MKIKFNYSSELQINGWFVGCIHVEEADISDKEMMAYKHKHGVIIRGENLVLISLTISDITLCEVWPCRTFARLADVKFTLLLPALGASFW